MKKSDVKNKKQESVFKTKSDMKKIDVKKQKKQQSVWKTKSDIKKQKVMSKNRKSRKVCVKQKVT